MDADTLYTLIGYAGSLLVIVSLAMTSRLKLRLFGLAGSATFLVYGVLIDAIPIVITNLVIISIHLYFLYQAWTDREYFSLLEVAPTSAYLAEFFNFYRSDIETFFPRFRYEPDEEDVALLVLRNMVPAAVFVGHPRDPDSLDVIIDYAIVQYRDFKVGEYLLGSRSEWFTSHGWTLLHATADSEAHKKYLQRMQFIADETGGYQRQIG